MSALLPALTLQRALSTAQQRRPALWSQGPSLSARLARHQIEPHTRCALPASSSGTPGRPSTLGDSASSVSATAAPPPLSSIQRFIADLDIQRVLVWVFIVFIGYQLQDFFGIAMGTFIISFIGNSFVGAASRSPLLTGFSPSSRRKLLVCTYFVAIASAIGTFGVLTIPTIAREGIDFVQRLEAQNFYTVVLEKMRHGLGDPTFELLERVVLVASNGADVLTTPSGASILTETAGREWTSARMQTLATALASSMRGYTEAAISVTTSLLGLVTKFALQLGMSLVLSFMMVIDLPAISNGVQSIKTSRLSAVYGEVAPSIGVFARLFGKALQAQAMIAAANTVLTLTGMYLLGIPGLGLLSMFVFLCSFIPIAGCFISTIPIGFVALTEYGFAKLAMVILMVVGVHMIEAYGLNPIIYSAHLKLHPLLVLAVLVVAEHSLGVWGLLLAVPSTVFFLDYVIRYPACSVTDVAAKELMNRK